MRGVKIIYTMDLPPNNQSQIMENLDHKGDLLIRDLSQKVTDSIHNMGVVNTDATSYQERLMEKCLQISGKKK